MIDPFFDPFEVSKYRYDTADTLIIFFEGIDKVGKTTLIRAFHERTNYKYITVDRGPISFLVYNKLRNRNRNITYNMIVNDIKALYVCMVADENDIKARFIEHNEKDMSLNDIKPYLQEFIKTSFEFRPRSNSKKIFINTSEMTIDEEVDVILEALNEA